MAVSRWGEKMAYSQQGWMEGWIMDAEMEERNTIAICVTPNWRLALTYSSEIQGQVTLGDSWVVRLACEKAQEGFNEHLIFCDDAASPSGHLRSMSVILNTDCLSLSITFVCRLLDMNSLHHVFTYIKEGSHACTCVWVSQRIHVVFYEP